MEETISVVCILFDLLTKTYYSVDRIFLWTVLARFDVPPNNLILVIDQLHNDLRAFVWLDNRMSGFFAVVQGLCEGWVLAPLLFNILFVAVIHVAYNTRFKAEKDTTNALVHLGRNRGRGAGGSSRQRASPGDVALGNDLRLRCRGHLAITRKAEEDDGRDRGRGRGFWPHRMGGQD